MYVFCFLLLLRVVVEWAGSVSCGRFASVCRERFVACAVMKGSLLFAEDARPCHLHLVPISCVARARFCGNTCPFIFFYLYFAPWVCVA
jgi:hypothetical protein